MPTPNQTRSGAEWMIHDALFFIRRTVSKRNKNFCALRDQIFTEPRIIQRQRDLFLDRSDAIRAGDRRKTKKLIKDFRDYVEPSYGFVKHNAELVNTLLFCSVATKGAPKSMWVWSIRGSTRMGVPHRYYDLVVRGNNIINPMAVRRRTAPEIYINYSDALRGHNNQFSVRPGSTFARRVPLRDLLDRLPQHQASWADNGNLFKPPYIPAAIHGRPTIVDAQTGKFVNARVVKAFRQSSFSIVGLNDQSTIYVTRSDDGQRLFSQGNSDMVSKRRKSLRSLDQQDRRAALTAR
jgi:hypothetical protein